jgi:chitin disaccharide deacetylase
VSSAREHSVIINADDFGISMEVNRAIIESFGRGTISSATLMANMAAFTDAVELVRSFSLSDRIGVHLNLSAGEPLTDPVRSLPRFCQDGRFLGRRPSVWRLSKDEVRAVRAEFAAQIGRIRGEGIRISHIDSHHHVHTEWPIASIVIELARANGVSAVRLSRNCGPVPSLPKRVYKAVLNGRLRRAGFAPVRHFGSAPDVASLTRIAGNLEVMVHPGLGPAGDIVDLTTGRGDLEEIAARFRLVGPMVSYAEIT